jgi:putative tryptophan/tyrosine transport system substrate-binding protein
MRRREFITLLGGAAAAWPLAARAQQPPLPVVGWLNNASPEPYSERVRAFRLGLKEAGFIESENVAVEYRWANGQNERLPELAADLVRRSVKVIFAAPTASVLAAKATTTTIPVVFTGGVDPVSSGLVVSLNRPGGNLTGVSNLTVELGPKQLELLHELVPSNSVIAVLINALNPNAETQSRNVQVAAQVLGQQIIVQKGSEAELATAFATIVQRKAGAVLVLNGFNNQQATLLALAAQYSMPALYPYREFVSAGGLASYGVSFTEPYRLAGIYAGRILKGEKPSDLPVQQATKIELVINLKTAKALRLTVPNSLLVAADEVIE